MILSALAFHSSLAQLSGLAYERDLNFIDASKQYLEEIEILEVEHGEFDIALFEPLAGLARSSFQLGDLETARDALRRAQHVAHRHEGVHTQTQLQLVELMTKVHLLNNKALLADKEQKFAYYIRQAQNAEGSLDELEALRHLDGWYQKTGQFQESRRLNQSSIDIVKAHLGENAIEQIPYIMELAKIKRLQRACCSTRVMNQALEVLEANPNSGAEIATNTYLAAADAHTATGNKNRASELYQKAWHLMSDQARIEHFSQPKQIAVSRPLGSSRPTNTRVYKQRKDALGRRDFTRLSDREVRELESLRPQAFTLTSGEPGYDIRIRDRNLNPDFDQEKVVRTIGQPYVFLRSQFLQALPNRYRKDDALRLLRVELEFEVDATGKPRNVTIRNEGLPPKLRQLMRESIRKSRFRPRMKDGMVVATRQFRITQTFAPSLTI